MPQILSDSPFPAQGGSDAAPSDPLRPRERILRAARDLFHRHGIRGVGVETIAEAAGTNKMTLYRHFDSKDDLILAYLRGVAVEADKSGGKSSAITPATCRHSYRRGWCARMNA